MIAPMTEDELLTLLTYFYNHGYGNGHNDTVEGAYTDVQPSDIDTYHRDVVKEIWDYL